MRKIKFINYMVLCVVVIVIILCGDLFDFVLIDNYGSGNFWKMEVQVSVYVDGFYDVLRVKVGQYVIIFGELRGGYYKDGVSVDGLIIFNGVIILQNLFREIFGVSKFGDIYGCIININFFIVYVIDVVFMLENKKNYYLGQVYGFCVFYYFDFYRVYGGVFICLGVEVVEGEFDLFKFFLGRVKFSEVMVQIKKDLDILFQYFGE